MASQPLDRSRPHDIRRMEQEVAHPSSGRRTDPVAEGPGPQAFTVVSPAAAAAPLDELARVGWPQLARGGLRVAVKPNLTWVEPRPGVTTTAEAVRLVVRALAEAGNRVSVVESDAGYGTFSADAAFRGHGIDRIAAEVGASVLNLSSLPTERIRAGGVDIPMPRSILHQTDVILSMPVPKVHFFTRYSGAVKNQWGLIPSDMRLRLHSRLTRILPELLERLPPQVVAMDGTYFLNGSGPLLGTAVRKDLAIFASNPVVADAVATRLMGWDAGEIGHLRAAAERAGVDLDGIPGLPRREAERFHLHRTFWQWVALPGYHSRLVNYLGYDSPIAPLLHRLKWRIERDMDIRRVRSRHGRAPGARSR